MRTWQKALLAISLAICLAAQTPRPARAEESSKDLFDPDAFYDVYVVNSDDKGSIIRHVKIVGVTSLKDKAVLIIQGQNVGNNTAKGFVLLDKVTTILPANNFTVLPANN